MEQLRNPISEGLVPQVGLPFERIEKYMLHLQNRLDRLEHGTPPSAVDDIPDATSAQVR